MSSEDLARLVDGRSPLRVAGATMLGLLILALLVAVALVTGAALNAPAMDGASYPLASSQASCDPACT